MSERIYENDGRNEVNGLPDGLPPGPLAEKDRSEDAHKPFTPKPSGARGSMANGTCGNQGDRSTADGEAMDRFVFRVLGILAGLACLAGPLVSLAAVIFFAPGYVEDRAAEYTQTYLTLFDTGAALSFQEFLRRLQFDAQRVAIETLARVYNALPAAFRLAAAAALLSILVHALFRHRQHLGKRGTAAKGAKYPSGRSGQRGRPFFFPSAGIQAIAELGLFALFLALTLCWLPPWPGARLVTAAVAVFALNFPLPSLARRWAPSLPARIAIGAAVWLGALAGLAHLLAPVGLFRFAAACFFPGSRRMAAVAVFLGRASACLVSFPVLAAALYRLPPVPLSPRASRVIDASHLYDIEIDRPANHLIVTHENGGAFVLSLTDLEERTFYVLSTPELEDIEIDPAHREIYHANRDTGEVLVLDADTFHLRRKAKIAGPRFSGTTKIALDSSSNSLLISWEDNCLFRMDRTSMAWTLLGSPGNVNLLADPSHRVVYLNSAQGRWMAALDVKNGRELRRAPASPWGERLALSERRGELYAADARGGWVWVYSTPDLRLLRKLPSQLGVRAIAVDDEHGLLLAASFVSGFVDLIDLASGRRLARQYVGKYCRIIRPDPPTRRAFITLTYEGLFVLRY
jgi:hypothetical protein